MRPVTASCVLIFFGNTLNAQQVPLLPRGPAPQFGAITAVDRETGNFVVTTVSKVYVPVEVQREIIEGGEKKTIASQEYLTNTEAFQRKIPFKACAFYDHTGAKLTEREACEKVRPATIVLESIDASPVDPFYLRALNADTLVLVAPPKAAIEHRFVPHRSNHGEAGGESPEPPQAIPVLPPAVKGPSNKG